MTVMDDIPPAPASQNEQWPLNPSSTEATQESQVFQSTEERQPETSSLPVAGSTSTPLPEPLAITSANADQAPVIAEPHPLTREKTGPTIGPLVDKSISNSQSSDAVGFSLLITLLLINGARHPFKIDEKYLKKRSVNADGGNPVNLSVYTLKELIWREWRDEWEPRPSSPSSIRLIFFGKLLEDKSKLHDCRFDNASTPHVVHMTVKPQEIVDEEDAKIAKTGNRDRDGDERSPSCRCIIL
ncbi:MAG: hypothetical protein LQ346_001692 [Caloplaca aetnensis]|nr:MAG: hypothetical protein LQ346_001692 [Caloplaca aetnensis]